jgi:hypothetical protein
MFAFYGDYPNQASCIKAMKNPPNYEWVANLKQCVYVNKDIIREWQLLQAEEKGAKL